MVVETLTRSSIIQPQPSSKTIDIFDETNKSDKSESDRENLNRSSFPKVVRRLFKKQRRIEEQSDDLYELNNVNDLNRSIRSRK